MLKPFFEDDLLARSMNPDVVCKGSNNPKKGSLLLKRSCRLITAMILLEAIVLPGRAVGGQA